MSHKRSKLIRQAFELKHGYSEIDRDRPDYKASWRVFKKNIIKSRRK